MVYNNGNVNGTDDKKKKCETNKINFHIYMNGCHRNKHAKRQKKICGFASDHAGRQSRRTHMLTQEAVEIIIIMIHYNLCNIFFSFTLSLIRLARSFHRTR